jgi:DNA segregation ATPase FtsK/SpoIIIE, S-DNA-T family
MYSLDDRQRRELWGLGLFALALLLALCLIPPALFGRSVAALFPSENLVGVVGLHVRDASVGLLGVAAVVPPLLAALWGAFAFRRVAAGPSIRWSVLLAGLGLLVPAGVAVAGGGSGTRTASAGSVGSATGELLVSGLSVVGATVVLVFLVAALSVATVGWNPLRSMLRGGHAALAGARQAAGSIPAFSLPSPLRVVPSRAGAERLPGTDLLVELPGPADAPDGRDDPEATRLDGGPGAAPPPRGPRRGEPRVEQVELLPVDPAEADAVALPAAGMLTAPPPRDEARNRQELERLGQVVIDKLATFRIEGEIVGMTTGPVVTQFEISPAPGVKVARIANLEADLALALRAPSVRIVAPIPGKGAVGVEVPNPVPEMVYFRETIESEAFATSRAALPLALGKDISGRPVVVDLSRMPHLLIAGVTGSGKSVCINTIITSLVFRHTPATLRFLMVDPKMVELSTYNHLPHLRHPVVTDNADAAAMLKWAVLEMERRYELLSVNGVRNLQDFNRRLAEGVLMRSAEPRGEEGDPDRWLYRGGVLPYVVVIIDELADLMMTVQGEVEKPLALLAQKARAIGIHLILATQRPSVNVITGLIKANFPTRIAFRVSSKVDSRTILDQNGADALLGNGDMLMLSAASGSPVRIQGAYLSTEETEALMAWYREQARERREREEDAGADEGHAAEANILDEVRARDDSGELEADEEVGERDRLFRQAAELCIQHQGGSTSLLQRRMRIGYGRAARIVDQLHLAGVLGPPDGSKPREILIDYPQLEGICGEE